jgi:recombination protein RecA
VVKSGAWYEYEGQKIAQGRETAKQYLKDNPKTLEKIAKQTREAIVKAEG